MSTSLLTMVPVLVLVPVVMMTVRASASSLHSFPSRLRCKVRVPRHAPASLCCARCVFTVGALCVIGIPCPAVHVAIVVTAEPSPCPVHTPMLRTCVVLAKAGMDTSAWDGAHAKHNKYNGVYLNGEGRDGNNNILNFAFGVVPKENSQYYREFGQFIDTSCTDATRNWLNKQKHSKFSDQHKGLPALMDIFVGSAVVNCGRHIMECMRKVAKSKFHDNQFWAVQTSLTKTEFDSNLEKLRATSATAAKYLEDNHPPETYAFYAIAVKGITMYGHKTSNIVEADNARNVAARHESPLHAMDMMLRKTMTDISARTKASKTWVDKGELLTPYATKM